MAFCHILAAAFLLPYDWIFYQALLNYISRDHEIEISPSSVVPLFVAYMDFFQIMVIVVASPGPFARIFSCFELKKMYAYFCFLLT